MITQRTVKFDGVHTALVQNFSYTTAYNAGVEQATVQTTVYSSDGSTNLGTFKTVYNYAAGFFGVSDPDDQVVVASPIPVEQTVQYYDFGQTTLLQTVTKGWQDQFLLGCQLDTHDGSGLRGTFFSYGAGGVVTAKNEYDYGQVTTGECPQAPGGGPITAPTGQTRETVATYQSFGDTPIYPTAPSILDRPATVKTYLNGTSGTLEAETDYSYDQSAVQAVSPTPTDHDETNYGATKTPPRGNATTIVTKCLQSAPACSSGNPTTTYTYDETGQALSATDPRSNITSYSYTDSYTSGTPPGNTNAYLTKTTLPQTSGINHIENFSYSYADGQPTQSKDQNAQTTTYKYNDSLDRLTETDFPDGGKTTLAYNDAPPTPTITTTKLINSSQSVVSVATMDGLGHVTQTQLTSDPQGTITTLKTLDGMGRDYQVYNPYRSTSDPTYGHTTYVYDALGRTTSVTKPDNSVVTTAYCSQDTLVTDEAHHWRRSATDGLGRLIEVDEPNSNTATVGACPAQGDPTWVTTYANDALDDLTAVVQGGSHNRSFTYDSLKRMTQSNNPESGVLKYTYDANGNVATKLDAKSVTTTYSYDALNRLARKTYSSGDPTVSLTYDQAACLGQAACYNIGRRTAMTDAGGTENLAYEKMGRELTEIRTTNSITMSTVYGYDLAGDLTTLIYPSGRVINYTYDSAGRASVALDGLDNVTYAYGSCANGASGNGVCYGPQGAISQINNGSNLVSTYLFNTRLQPCWTYATTGTALATSTSCTATESTVGNILDLKYCFYTWSSGACQSSTTNNGNVIGVTNNRDSTRTQSFAYDQVNRILSGQTSSTSGSNCWGETYTYDQWANMYAIGALSGFSACTQENLSVSTNANNQLTFGAQFTYDANGNTLSDGLNDYQWNAENEMSNGSGVAYTYDGDGNRLMKANQKIYWYGAGGEILDESDTTGRVTNEYIFFAGKRIAMSVNPVVQNASFETSGLTSQTCGSFNTGPIPAWTSSGTAGSWVPCASNYSSLPDGNVIAYSNGGTISQTLTNANFQPNTTYTLSVGVGHRADCCSPQNYTIALEAGSNVVASTNGSTSNITAGTFATVTVTYTTGSTPPSGNIGVALTSAGDQVGFDNVQLGMSGTVPDRSIYFYAEDMLGTSRTIIADTQTSVCYDADFYPFGGERTITNTCPQNYKFEGKERDMETGDDDFGARYYASRLGRFMSPDDPLADQQPEDPQSWNLYSYVRNNPLINTDLDGRTCTKDSNGNYHGDTCGQDTGTGNTPQTVVVTPSYDELKFMMLRSLGDKLSSPRQWVDLAKNALENTTTGGMMAGTAEQCGLEKCSKADVAMAVLPLLPELKLLGLAEKEERAIGGVLKQIADGTTKGKEFLNAAGQLPAKAAGYYREFTVPVAGQAGRGAARLVTGAAGEIYYTADHYVTFTRIK